MSLKFAQGKFIRLSPTILGVALFCLLAVSGRANTYNFWTANGATTIDSGGILSDVSLKVTFITSTNQVEVRITNLLVNPTKETQAVASVDFLLAGFSGVQPTAISLKKNLTTDPDLGYVVNFAGKKSTAYTTASITTAPTDAWGITNTNILSGGTQISAISGGSPDYLIIGKSTSATDYVGVNNAVTGHTPFLGTNPDDYIAFTLTYAPTAGITANTAISKQNMPIVDFGTTFAAGQELVLTDQPEPETLTLMTCAMGLFLALTMIRTRVKSNEEKRAAKG